MQTHGSIRPLHLGKFWLPQGMADSRKGDHLYGSSWLQGKCSRVQGVSAAEQPQQQVKSFPDSRGEGLEFISWWGELQGSRQHVGQERTLQSSLENRSHYLWQTNCNSPSYFTWIFYKGEVEVIVLVLPGPHQQMAGGRGRGLKLTDISCLKFCRLDVRNWGVSSVVISLNPPRRSSLLLLALSSLPATSGVLGWRCTTPGLRPHVVFSLCLHMLSSLCACLCLCPNFSSYKDTSLTRLAPTLGASFSLCYIC